jgi:hypothetical protein
VTFKVGSNQHYPRSKWRRQRPNNDTAGAASGNILPTANGAVTDWVRGLRANRQWRHLTVGNSTGSITVDARSDITLSAGQGDYGYAQIGNGGAARQATIPASIT